MNINTIGHTLLLVLVLNGVILSSNEYRPSESNVIPCSDYLALKALYLATDGDNWDNNTGWMTENEFQMYPTLPIGENMGSWDGVTLSAQGYVSKLNLQGNNLVGQLPMEIGAFCGIEELNLSFNLMLIGAIPDSLSKLTNLTILNLGANSLSGSLPLGLDSLQNLETLELKNNFLSGSIPPEIGNISSLIHLGLSENSLSGSIPVSIGNLTNLTSLLLQDNNLSGPIPTQLGFLNSLGNMLLSSNQLSGSIPNSLGNLSNLSNLWLQDNQLTGRIPSSLGNLSLNTLILSNNDLYGCYDSNLLNLCGSIITNTNSFVSDGNKFCIPWEDFCNSQVGLCGSTSNDDAYCFCETILNLSENPEPDRIERASYKITSNDIVDYNTPTSYTAGNHIALEPGFEVLPNVQFEAEIEGCEEECSVSEPCESSPCAEVDFELDSDGNKYVPNQIAIVFPAAIGGASSNQDQIMNYLDDIFFNNNFIANPPATIQIFKSGTSIEKCLCDHDIYLYTVDPIYIINEEGGGVAANSNGGPMDEGPSYSLNHYIDAGLLNEDAPDTVLNSPIINPNVINSDTTTTRVAFLDSGINPDILPASSLLGTALVKNTLGDIGCLNQSPYDMYGWNFVEGNDDILDRRGHGTAVYLSYLYALNKLGLNVNDQSSIIVKVLSDCGLGTAFDAACGIQYAVDKGAEIINMSWGLYANNLLLQEVIHEVTTNHDVLFSCSSGNAGQDIANKEHFPSGYGYPHIKVINPQTGATTLSSIPEVFEVGGLCREITDPNCLAVNEEVSFWSSANFRSGNAIFAEAAIEIQEIVDTTISCGIMGTSYAAPHFTAGLVNEVINIGVENITKTHMFNNSVSWDDVTTNSSYYSYILANDESCN